MLLQLVAFVLVFVALGLQFVDFAFSGFDGVGGGGSPLLDEPLQFRQSFGHGIDRAADMARLRQRAQCHGKIIQTKCGATAVHADHAADGIRREPFRRTRNDDVFRFRQDKHFRNLLQSGHVKDVIRNRLLLSQMLLDSSFHFDQ